MEEVDDTEMEGVVDDDGVRVTEGDTEGDGDGDGVYETEKHTWSDASKYKS